MLPALIVGGLTAWYLGVRAGVLVAVATAIALLIAMVVPGMSLAVYALVVAWAAALYFFGPKISKATGQSGLLGGTFGQAKSWAAKIMGKKP
ncbi:MAG: hypothetical protein JWO36_309 [Myxococcales bacterium]|nr:hypothetical protein [Myxococcales bacterium]